VSNLLQVVRSHPKALQKKGVRPLILEFNVSPETAPYLVTSTTGVLWIAEPHPGDVIKSAVRDIEAPGDIFAECLRAVAERGLKYRWGNTHPFTEAGLDAAVDHVQSYDLPDIEVLVGQRSKDNPAPKWLTPKELQLPIRVSSWVPENCAVVVPANREFVGYIVHLRPKTIAVAIHNASRAISIAWDMPAPEKKAKLKKAKPKKSKAPASEETPAQ
jgi:hypothetical protein